MGLPGSRSWLAASEAEGNLGVGGAYTNYPGKFMSKVCQGQGQNSFLCLEAQRVKPPGFASD